MILLITSSANGPQCADSLHAATGQETQWAQTLQEATTRLREQTYNAAVIDQFLLETEPDESDQMLEHLGTAFPVYVNFAVTGMERLVRAMLLSCELANVRARRSPSCRREDPRHRQPRTRTPAPAGGELSHIHPAA